MTYWKLDKTEDKWRRRLKLKRNYKFDKCLCQPSSIKSSNENAAPTVDPSANAKITEKMKHLLLKGVRGITGDNSSESCESNDMSDTPQNVQPENHPVSDNTDSADSSDYPAIVQNRKESSSTSSDNDYIEVSMFIM